MFRAQEGNRASVAAAIVLAACAALAGARSVAVGFHPARERLVQSEVTLAAGETLSRTVPATDQPLSVVVVEAHGSAGPSTLEVRANGTLLAREKVASKRTRVDVQVASALVPASRLELACPSSACAVNYLELANLHGFSNGLLNAYFLPASRHDYRSYPPWVMGVVLVLLALAWMPPAAGRHPRTETVAAGLGALVLALSLLSPLVSRYALVLGPPTFLLCLVLMFGASLRRRYLSLRARLAASRATAARWLDGVAASLAILIFYVAVAGHGLEVNRGNYTAFLHFNEPFAHAPVLDDQPDLRASIESHPTGYDGQFMFLMAFDPLLTRYEPARYGEIVDSPAYRYGRIGFSALTRLFSGGRPGLFAPTMVWLIVGAQLAAAAFLVAIVIGRGGTPWQALPYVLIPGFLVSVGSALPEPIAAALLLGGLLAHQHDRPWLAAAAWGASLLVRETGAILVLVVIAWMLLKERRGWRALQMLAVFVPVALWRLYVGLRLFPVAGWRAFWNGAEDLTWPFAGFLDLWSTNGHGQSFSALFPVVLIALLAVAVAIFYVRRNWVAAAAIAYGVLAVSFNYRKVWSSVGNGERITFEVFLLVFVAALPFGSLPRGLRWALAAFAIALFAYDFQASTYATWFRPGLIVFR